MGVGGGGVGGGHRVARRKQCVVQLLWHLFKRLRHSLRIVYCWDVCVSHFCLVVCCCFPLFWKVSLLLGSPRYNHTG